MNESPVNSTSSFQRPHFSNRMLDARVVGALACQKDSYLRTLEAQVVSCTKAAAIPDTRATQKDTKKSKASKSSKPPSQELWQIEFTDSVLFPEGGGQPSDHGTITPVSNDNASSILQISNVQRHGLRCIAYSPTPLEPGTSVLQSVNFSRRWDHMQQHTGQHLLSAIMDTYPNLETLGWGMGAADTANYVDLPRRPSEEEIRAIEGRCNEVIRENVKISVETAGRGGKLDLGHMPEDYDAEKGVVRVIRIEDIDANPCCGTHLQQTSHISLILLLGSTSVHGGNTRLSFVCGDRAVRMATTALTSLRTISTSLGCNPAPAETVAAVARTKETANVEKKKVSKLLQEIAKFESDRAKAALAAGFNVFVHRAEDGAEFLPMVMRDIRDTVAKHHERTAVLTSGEVKASGQIMILGKSEEVVKAMKEIGIDVKGGGRPGQWQGKVVEWKKGEVEKLREAIR